MLKSPGWFSTFPGAPCEYASFEQDTKNATIKTKVGSNSIIMELTRGNGSYSYIALEFDRIRSS